MNKKWMKDEWGWMKDKWGLNKKSLRPIQTWKSIKIEDRKTIEKSIKTCF
jgi:hypothetical protein